MPLNTLYQLTMLSASITLAKSVYLPYSRLELNIVIILLSYRQAETTRKQLIQLMMLGFKKILQPTLPQITKYTVILLLVTVTVDKAGGQIRSDFLLTHSRNGE